MTKEGHADAQISAAVKAMEVAHKAHLVTQLKAAIKVKELEISSMDTKLTPATFYGMLKPITESRPQ